MRNREGRVLLETFDQRWQEYLLLLRAGRAEASEEAIHDLRVATRRLLAMLELIGELETQPAVQKPRRELKRQMDKLDDLRDVQVMLIEISTFEKRRPALEELRPYLEKREEKLLRAAGRELRAAKPSELRRRAARIRKTLVKTANTQDLRARLLGAADSAYARVSRAHGPGPIKAPESIHRTRIAFKKFRYTAEILWPILSRAPKRHLKGMRSYQRIMGEIGDLSVFLGMITRHARTAAAKLEFSTTRRLLEQKREAAIAAFVRQEHELRTFWRPDPRQPFPWEKRNDPIRSASRNRRPRRSGEKPARPRSPAHGQGTQEDAADRRRAAQPERRAGPYPSKPVPANAADGAGAVEVLRPE